MSMPLEGSKAPSFSGKDQEGTTRSLKDYKGKKLVLYFYPQDNTPTCTDQACHLRDHFSALKAEGIQVIGVSPDETDSHLRFASKYELPFPLLADPKRKIIEKYGVWGEKQMFGNRYMGLLRTSFLLDEKGIIVKIIRKPKVRDHSREILTAFGKR